VAGGHAQLTAWVYGSNRLVKMMNDKDKPRNLTNIIEDNKDKKPEGLTFPCVYPVKAMGANTEKFKQEMLFIAQKHFEEVNESHVRTNQSKTGKYQSVTIHVEATSRVQLEALFMEIKAHIDVKWML
jgi:putative lipoic acid-binding regulatory protein